MSRAKVILAIVFTALAGAASVAQQPTPTPSRTAPSAPAKPVVTRQQADKAGQNPAAQPSRSKKSDATRPDDGLLVDGIYTEKFFNLRYSVPQGWTVQTDEMRKGLPSGDTVLLLSAFAEPKPKADAVNSSITISAESAAQYKEAVDAEAYLEAVKNFAITKGFKVLNEPGEIEIGGVTFLRGDFVRESADNVNTYQATMVTVRKGYILSVTAISGDEEQLTPLLNRLRIIAPPSLRRP
ncbi:MAG TPA: hypothetical protein VD837_03965 [Terriglobales bacterium]|nr:hypothetical protein [Terriglobales bacterium]